ncbi:MULTISPECIES: glucose-1-phosphate cytidylyltransferase [unclassified Prochlorococcus]|uniref:glucose-1-phosphate cytidylyltransferase n=1 Tax=unclassified Prochlorococcus TaxID=2627481 RepID=UPI000533BC82|nr:MULTISPECIES: glucose-1-phosphate cytidylyltransferase [unclassified Prochlorococcus]KGG16341.1 Glucose-1-phosphate cytidylyltransferase [Prochlorococcus sp. MIT 0603]KGG17925.1 Glucose-1-phosphate cytidylyltransferase [Prochlorococcus sp. MIT 0602]
MKAVILAGGFGTRLSEETNIRPKPMVEIGEKPILWHILKSYSSYGINDFIICCGYKGNLIKQYFANYFLYTSDVTFYMEKNDIEIHHTKTEPWKITLVDTGIETMTGGRLARVSDYLDETFCFTYGDGVADINIKSLIDFHYQHGKKATLTAVKPPGRFGLINLDRNKVTDFIEKPKGDGSWINGGYFVLQKSVLELISGDKCTWEDYPLKTLARNGELLAYKHDGFWQPMDTMRDKHKLEDLWASDNPPWKVWE